MIMDNNEHKSLNQIIDYRIKKIDEFRNNDINPYPYKFRKDLNIYFINENEEKLKEKNIITAGRIISMRSMGKAAFMNIQDEFDKIQLYIKNDIVGISTYDKIVKQLDIGDIVGINGKLFQNQLVPKYTLQNQWQVLMYLTVLLLTIQKALRKSHKVC